MSALDSDLVPVPLGFCPCKGGPHEDGDIVYLYPELSAASGVRARAWVVAAMEGKLDSVTVQVLIAELWLEVGVAEWTFLLDDGSPIPVTPENITRALPYGKGGRLVADKGDDLYFQSVYVPLAEELARLSPPGSTSNGRAATSRRTTSTPKPPQRSSTATTDKVPPPE